MPRHRVFSDIRLVNGSVGDPVLYIDYPTRDNALLFDCGDNAALPMERLADLEAVFITHHHVDHFMGLDRIVRAVTDCDKTVSVFGPAGTIRKLYDRIRSYEYPFFPFQKIVLDVIEVHPDRLRSARLDCRRKFPEPEVTERPWTCDEAIFENDEVRVEAGHVDHTVPCLAFAFVEKPGWHFDATRLERGLLRGGAWIDQAAADLRNNCDQSKCIEIQGGTFTLGSLAEQFFRRSNGARVAYITDTAWSDASRPTLLRLAAGAQRVYCDAFYLEKDAKHAEKHRHMTAARAAELARLAKAEELFLIHFSKRYAGCYGLLLEEARAGFGCVQAQFHEDVPDERTTGNRPDERSGNDERPDARRGRRPAAGG